MWRESWTLGIAALDLDHRQLAALLDRIGSRIIAAPQRVSGPAQDALIADLARLGALTRVHFRCEENLMRRSDYSRFHRHKAEHDLLLAEYTVLMRELATGAANVLDLGVLAALKAWFLGHLLDDDRRLAAHLHALNPPATRSRG